MFASFIARSQRPAEFSHSVNVPGVLFSAFGEIDPVLMWLNAFFALQLIIHAKSGGSNDNRRTERQS